MIAETPAAAKMVMNKPKSPAFAEFAVWTYRLRLRELGLLGSASGVSWDSWETHKVTTVLTVDSKRNALTVDSKRKALTSLDIVVIQYPWPGRREILDWCSEVFSDFGYFHLKYYSFR